MPSVSEFLIDRMRSAGIKHVFGVPGDYVLNFYKKLSDCEHIEIIGATSEEHAGFAADAYARVAGIGCVCVTYNVGALKIANSVACSYAERSPVVVISGSPGMREREEGLLLHHMVRSFGCQKDVFENITCASTVLDNPNRAGYEIDRVFEAMMHHKQPIYIELPRDIADKPIKYDVYTQGTPEAPKSNQDALQEALEEAKTLLSAAKRPVILAGVQLARYGLGSELIKFAEKLNIPVTTTLLSKSVVDETHRLFHGIYMGGGSEPHVKDLVDNSDCLFVLGVLLTDIAMAFKPAKFLKKDAIHCSVEGLRIKNHKYDKVQFLDFCKSLFKMNVPPKKMDYITIPFHKKDTSFTPSPGAKLTSDRFFTKINSIITSNMSILADVGNALFGASELVIRHKNNFVANAFYTSMGATIPAALGVQIARPDSRVIAIVGDGAFQMSVSEISSLARRKLNPIVFVLNNGGYATERFLIDGPFNDIANWQYHKVTELVGGGTGVLVETEEQLNSAVQVALDSKELFVVNVILGKNDVSEPMKRMSAGLSQKV